MKKFLLFVSTAMVASASARSEVVIGHDGEKKKALAVLKNFYDEKAKVGNLK